MTVSEDRTGRRLISDEKFSKNEHMLKSGEFRAVYKNGRSVRSEGFVLSVAGNGLEHNRLGFSISSSCIKRAHIRNRIRRLFREVYRKNKPLFKKAYDIVIIVRKNPGDNLFYENAHRILLSLASKAEILA